MHTHTRAHSSTSFFIVFRQKTALDDVCLEKDPETNEPYGSRVFGDCDLLMREVMKCIMPADELMKWESDRASRMKKYDKQRKP